MRKRERQRAKLLERKWMLVCKLWVCICANVWVCLHIAFFLQSSVYLNESVLVHQRAHLMP